MMPLIKVSDCARNTSVLEVLVSCLLLVLGSSAFGQNTASKKLPCPAATALANKIYDRFEAERDVVHRHASAMALWDLFDQASSCWDLTPMKEELERTGYSKNSQRPTQVTFAPSLQGLPKDCYSSGSMICTILVSKPGKAVSSGQQPNEWLMLDIQKNSELPLSTEGKWKYLDRNKILVPSVNPAQGKRE
jgi:hypothetical protein